MAEKQFRLTAQKVEELRAELETLETVERKKVADRLGRLRGTTEEEMDASFSDLLDDKNYLEKRILEIKEILKNFEIVDTSAHVDSVQLGSTVKVGFEGFEAEYMIVSALEADPLNGKISDESPVGNALLNAKEGDEIDVDNGMVKKKYRVLKIL